MKLSRDKVFYAMILFTGIILLVFEIGIYRMTMIRAIIPISIILAVGVTAFFFNRSHYKKTYNVQGLFFPMMQNIFSWGSIASFLFMASNYYPGVNELNDLRFKIQSKSSVPGPKGKRDKRKPLVTIDYFGLEKELIFSYEDTESVENADTINATIRKGFLGFDVIDHYDTGDANGK